MELKKPEEADKLAILEMIEEFLLHDSDTAGLWDFQIGEMAYEDWLASLYQREVGLLGIPAIQFVAFEGHTALGFLNLRLRLNDSLLQKGGHIGYSVRPSQRGKGYAKEMLAQGLQVALTKNIQRVLVTCGEENLASRSVILANAGILENIVQGTERYWIEVADESSQTTRVEE